jgi:hypothetical protein
MRTRQLVTLAAALAAQAMLAALGKWTTIAFARDEAVQLRKTRRIPGVPVCAGVSGAE